jgi:hypothetical protein
MVHLTLATSETVSVNGVSCAGPVTMVGDSFSLLGQSLVEGSWLVGLNGGSPFLVEIAASTWWRVDVVWPLAVLCGILVALRGLKIS